MRTTMGLFQPGTSLMHRLPAGAKLLGLVLVSAASVFLQRDWRVSLGCLLAVVLAYFACGFRARLVWQQARPMLFMLAVVALLQWWSIGWQRTVALCAMVLVLVLAAALVTLTTRTTALVDAVVRASQPLARFGVDPERVGLMLNLGIRCVPLVATIAAEVREAQVARVGDFSLRAFAVPLVVRCLRDADSLGEALAARGIDD